MSSPEDYAGPEPLSEINLAAFCALGMQAELITGLLRDMLIRRFLDPEFIRRTPLREILWRENETTDILIESHTRWKPELTEKRPGIIIKRNSYRNYRVGIGDFAGADEQGAERHATFWVGSHTVFCLRESGAAAEQLAAEVRDHLLEFGPTLLYNLQLQQYQVQQVGTIGKIDDSRILTYAVPITLGWAYEHAWTVEQESLPLRRVSLQMLTSF
jgi:hypothetical protein